MGVFTRISISTTHATFQDGNGGTLMLPYTVDLARATKLNVSYSLAEGAAKTSGPMGSTTAEPYLPSSGAQPPPGWTGATAHDRKPPEAS